MISIVLLDNLLASLSLETLPVKELEMIELSSLEWFILLFIVILITWLLILIQVRTVESEIDQPQFHGDHELKTQEQSAGESIGD